ncbi:hypothetical protein PWP93_28170 [Paraburkholderia sp. A1RI-2L]
MTTGLESFVICFPSRARQPKSVLQGLSDSVTNEIRERLSNLRNLSVDLATTDNSATGGTGGSSKRIWRHIAVCPLLDELIAAAFGTSDVH